MIRIVRPKAMQFIQQVPGDQLGRGVSHAMDHPVSHRPNRFKTILLFQPINQGIRRRFVIGGSEIAALRLFPGRALERQIGPAQADAVNLPRKPPLRRSAGLIHREPDARRAAVNRQDAGQPEYHGSTPLIFLTVSGAVRKLVFTLRAHAGRQNQSAGEIRDRLRARGGNVRGATSPAAAGFLPRDPARRSRTAARG